MSLRTKWKMLVALSCFCYAGYFLIGWEGHQAFIHHHNLVILSAFFQVIPILCLHRRLTKAMEKVDAQLGKHAYMDFLGPETAWKDE